MNKTQQHTGCTIRSKTPVPLTLCNRKVSDLLEFSFTSKNHTLQVLALTYHHIHEFQFTEPLSTKSKCGWLITAADQDTGCTVFHFLVEIQISFTPETSMPWLFTLLNCILIRKQNNAVFSNCIKDFKESHINIMSSKQAAFTKFIHKWQVKYTDVSGKPSSGNRGNITSDASRRKIPFCCSL